MEAVDLVSLVSLLGGAADGAVRARLAELGFGDLRVPHGYVVQRLLERPRTATELARELAVSQQAVSKLVAELERGGYVARVADGEDARRRPVALTDRGLAAVTAAREERAALTARMTAHLEATDALALERLLRAALAGLGLDEAVRDRRAPLPR
jgi:DNA-binding MarR family transcriptional regulator